VANAFTHPVATADTDYHADLNQPEYALVLLLIIVIVGLSLFYKGKNHGETRSETEGEAEYNWADRIELSHLNFLLTDKGFQ
jgi:hypothetical protein